MPFGYPEDASPEDLWNPEWETIPLESLTWLDATKRFGSVLHTKYGLHLNKCLIYIIDEYYQKLAFFDAVRKRLKARLDDADAAGIIYRNTEYLEASRELTELLEIVDQFHDATGYWADAILTQEISPREALQLMGVEDTSAYDAAMAVSKDDKPVMDQFKYWLHYSDEDYASLVGGIKKNAEEHASKRLGSCDKELRTISEIPKPPKPGGSSAMNISSQKRRELQELYEQYLDANAMASRLNSWPYKRVLGDSDSDND